jgi:FkbM family methyltransferase
LNARLGTVVVRRLSDNKESTPKLAENTVGRLADLISPYSPLGAFLRLPVKMLPRNTVLPILSGPARGLKWRVKSGIQRMWFGTYERPVIERFAGIVSTLPSDLGVYDVGAHAGYYALVAARLTSPQRRVVAIEPLPANVRELRHNLIANGLSASVIILQAAVSDTSGDAFFAVDQRSEMGKLSSSGSLRVETVTLDRVYHENGIRPGIIKIDVEGAGAAVLKGATRILIEFKPVILLAVHSGTSEKEETDVLLSAAGYRRFVLLADTYLWEPT